MKKQINNDNRQTGSKSRHIPEENASTGIGPQEWERAKTKVGNTVRARLAWALRFAQQDPAELTAGELLDDRVRLRAFTRPTLVLKEPLPLWQLPGAASVAMARREIANILVPLKPGQTRRVKIETTGIVSCAGADEPPTVGFMDQTGGAVMQFILLLNEYRNELRRCEDPKCRRWYIGRPNKHFCLITCLSRVTTERLRKGEK